MCFGCRIHLCVVLFNRRFLPAKGEWERIFRKHRDTGAFGGAYLFCAGSQKHSGRRHVPQNPYFINRAFHIGVRRLDCALCRWVSVINGRKKGKKMEYDEILEERFELASERILGIQNTQDVSLAYQDYFRRAAQFLGLADDTFRQKRSGGLEKWTLKDWEERNKRLYWEMLPEQYADSYLNPAFAARVFGETFGRLLSFLYTELFAVTAYAFEGRLFYMTIFYELFLEIYHVFEMEGDPQPKEIEQILYWFFHDYSEAFSEDKVRGLVDPENNFFTELVMESDLTDLRFLYRYGAYISQCERETAAFLNTLSEAELASMADTMTEGFRIGYEKLGKELRKKETVCIEYPIGFERVARAVIRNFAKMGLRPAIYRNTLSSFHMGSGARRGCYTASANPQFEFDHKSDSALYLDKVYVKRRVETMKAAFEKYKKQARRHAGPAVIEIFGEEPFLPQSKPEAFSYSLKQNEWKVSLMNQLGQLTEDYIPGDERSFTMIAYPVPVIGQDFEQIFRETVKINTLDYMQYLRIQQSMIETLDLADRVHITGAGENETDLWVKIQPVFDLKKETAFENCVADVNIPVGEGFTTPALEGTSGTLHVAEAYLNGLPYRNLKLKFKDGMVAAYSCENFASEEENQRYIYENLLQRHETLPMGEFAIGTNTAAYRMAKQYHIADKLPILIAEKMGPHFAVGDTCYSHAEDTKVYNPDGREIIARDNSRSVLRKEDSAKAYFNCHTDITVPYDEIGSITVKTADNQSIDIIRNGKFAVTGAEALNLPLE